MDSHGHSHIGSSQISQPIVALAYHEDMLRHKDKRCAGLQSKDPTHVTAIIDGMNESSIIVVIQEGSLGWKPMQGLCTCRQMSYIVGQKC